jgi:prepilin-type processing-associated H-X9-DG protein
VSANVRMYLGLHEPFLFVLWAAVIFGCARSQKKLHKNLSRGRAYIWLGTLLLVAVLIRALTMPAVFSGPPSPERTQCRDNLHDIGLALHNYHDFHDSFPAQFAGKPPVSWRVSVLPFLDQSELYGRYDATAAWDSPANLPIARHVIPQYTCPTIPHWYRERDGLHFTSYAVIAGSNTIWRGDRPTSFGMMTDGSSNTVMVVEACGQQIIWTEPRDMDLATTPTGFNLPGTSAGQSDGLFSSYHTGGTHILMADGAVRFISVHTEPAVIEALLSNEGGDEVGEF